MKICKHVLYLHKKCPLSFLPLKLVNIYHFSVFALAKITMLFEFRPKLQVEKLRIVNCTMFQEE